MRPANYGVKICGEWRDENDDSYLFACNCGRAYNLRLNEIYNHLTRYHALSHLEARDMLVDYIGGEMDRAHRAIEESRHILRGLCNSAGEPGI